MDGFICTSRECRKLLVAVSYVGVRCVQHIRSQMKRRLGWKTGLRYVRFLLLYQNMFYSEIGVVHNESQGGAFGVLDASDTY